VCLTQGAGRRGAFGFPLHGRNAWERYPAGFAVKIHRLLVGDDAVVPTHHTQYLAALLVDQVLFARDGDATGVAVGADHGLDGDLIDSEEHVLDGDVRFHDELVRKRGTD
jgi:hypothetical protein